MFARARRRKLRTIMVEAPPDASPSPLCALAGAWHPPARHATSSLSDLGRCPLTLCAYRCAASERYATHLASLENGRDVAKELGDAKMRHLRRPRMRVVMRPACSRLKGRDGLARALQKSAEGARRQKMPFHIDTTCTRSGYIL